MTDQPLVSVICLCYNQAPWVEEAIEAVMNQTYRPFEIILADDASTDNSAEKIKQLKAKYPAIYIILSDTNQGNCKTFNRAFKKARGEYIIDLAADDVMMSNRIEKQVRYFQQLNETYGVVFTDAEYVDAQGSFLRNHYEDLARKNLLHQVPQGDVYRAVLARYFIASPTMMIKRAVFEKLDGYDETLAYEDFDFWIRSARYFNYAFLNERLTRIRRSGWSMSTRLYHKGDRQLHSTYLVCKKAMHLNRDEEDNQVLKQRVKYELRQAVLSDNHPEGDLFYSLLQELNGISFVDKAIHTLNKLRLKLRWIRSTYHRLRYGKG